MDKKAFTMIEVIISTLIIAVLAAGILGAFVGAEHFFNRSMHRMQAFNFAREAQDRLRSNYGYTDSQMDIKNGHLESEIGTILRGEMTDLGPPPTTLTYDVAYDVAEANPDGYKAVTVHVTWTETGF